MGFLPYSAAMSGAARASSTKKATTHSATRPVRSRRKTSSMRNIRASAEAPLQIPHGKHFQNVAEIYRGAIFQAPIRVRNGRITPIETCATRKATEVNNLA
ncbi:hypothetical protein GCM10012286_75580 [Streptomyces lasiicapitis]|uniref:Uncharacterized protein n=1 Tax=Streptomyces lasiicapitis TaxID=1923961 RepID=A0ABQ2MTX8_9ACTN|nr:hypothetical protein GCM10012286_75580 [Streptomyces lasiicapitis]